MAAGPSPFLKKECDLPFRLMRPFIKVGATYYDVVDRAVKAGLQKWVPRRRVHHHHGVPVVSGVFAVGKSDPDERRIISAAVPANMLLDMSRVPRPRFPNITQVATVKEVPRGSKLLVSKRDVRHCYHKVRASRRWRALRAHPPPEPVGVMKGYTKAKSYPVHAAWRAIRDNSSRCCGCVHGWRRGLDRVRCGDIGPDSFPLYGIMMDDIWAVDCAADEVREELLGSRVVRLGAEQWARVDLEEHPKKRVVAAAGE